MRNPPDPTHHAQVNVGSLFYNMQAWWFSSYKQLPPHRTVGTIGSAWLESTPSKETTGPAQTRRANAMKNEQSEMLNGARAAFAWARGL